MDTLLYVYLYPKCRDSSIVDILSTSSCQKDQDQNTIYGCSLYGQLDWIGIVNRQLHVHKEVHLGEELEIILGSRVFIFSVKRVINTDGVQVTGGKINQATEFLCVKEREVQAWIIPKGSQGQYEVKVPYKREREMLEECIDSYFTNGDIHKRLKINPVQHALITGPSGVGKSMISQDVLENIAHPKLEIDLEKVLINSISGGDISDYFQQTLDDVLERAQLVSPSIIVADHLESLIDYDNNAYPATSSLSLFTQFINRIPAGVFVISIGSDFQKSDIRLKALSEMPLIIDISIPTLETRTLLLRSIIDDLSDVLKNTLPEKYIPDGRALENQILSQIAELTSGYTARDLKSVCRQAYLLKYNDNQNLEYAHDSMDIVPLFAKLTLSTNNTQCRSLLTLKDFRTPLQIVRPSQQIMFETNIPKTFWKQICGYDSEKAVIKRFIALNSGKSTKLGINPQSGLLLYGPSGCGKTFMAQAAMTECNYNVIQLKTTELYSKYFGQTEAHIRRLFKTARSIAPVIVFMDDIDMIAAKREWDSVDSSGGLQERVLSTLLNEMDGIESRNRVMFIGCTNQPQNVDDAILRPGRFDKLVKIAYPSESDRKAIFNLASKKLPLKGHIDFEDLAKKTEGFTCSQMDQLIRETGMAALRENLSSEYAEMRHFKAALDTILSQLSVKSVERDAEMHAINAFENDIEK